jgi:hypothetical protein
MAPRRKKGSACIEPDLAPDVTPVKHPGKPKKGGDGGEKEAKKDGNPFKPKKATHLGDYTLCTTGECEAQVARPAKVAKVKGADTSPEGYAFDNRNVCGDKKMFTRKGKDGKLAKCPMQLTTQGGKTVIQICRGHRQPGEKAVVATPGEAARVAARACDYWRTRGSWEGFGFQGLRGKKRKARRR